MNIWRTKRLHIVTETEEQTRQRLQTERDDIIRVQLTVLAEQYANNPKDRFFTSCRQILRREDGAYVGSLWFKGPPQKGSVEIVCIIEEAYRGRGYATEAVRAAIGHAFSREAVYFISAEVDPGHKAELRVLEKLQFKAAGQGTNGLLFEIEKPDSAWMTTYMSIGMCLGISLGTATDNLAIGLSTGLCLGLAVGAALDARDKKIRASLKAERGAAPDREPAD